MSERGLAKFHPSSCAASFLRDVFFVQLLLNLVIAVAVVTCKTMAAMRPLTVRGSPELRVIVWVGGCFVFVCPCLVT